MKTHGGAQAHWEAAVDAVRRLRQDPVRHSVGVLVMSLMLALPGVAWMALRGLDLLVPVESLTSGVSVFLAEDVDDSALTGFVDEMGARDEVFAVEVIGQEQGLLALSQAAGLGDLVGAFQENPLPNVARLILIPDVAPEFSKSLSLELESDPRVAFVRVDEGFSREMRNAIVLGQRLVLILGVMVVLAIILVVTGATRIEVTKERAELALVDLVGGTLTYARRPFLYMGVLQGLVGGLLASGVVFLGSLLISAPLSRLLVLYGDAQTVLRPTLLDLGMPLILGLFLGFLGARLAARVPRVAWD